MDEGLKHQVLYQVLRAHVRTDCWMLVQPYEDKWIMQEDELEGFDGEDMGDNGWDVGNGMDRMMGWIRDGEMSSGPTLAHVVMDVKR